MKFSVDKQDGYVVFTPQDERLNTVNAPDLKSELVLLHNEGFRNLILDLHHISTIDSSGLSAFLMAKRLCDSVGGVFTLCELTPHVRKMLEIAQLHKVINILPTLAEAVQDAMMHELQAELANDEVGPGITTRAEEKRLDIDPAN
jgi:anti-anti-sigma factor